MTSHEETRKKRLAIIKAVLKGKKLSIDQKESHIATWAMDWGASRRTILEYIKIVELSK